MLPTQANVFEHFTPKYDQDLSVKHHENEHEQKFLRLEKIRQSKQRSSYNLNRGINSISRSRQDNRAINSISARQQDNKA